MGYSYIYQHSKLELHRTSSCKSQVFGYIPNFIIVYAYNRYVSKNLRM